MTLAAIENVNYQSPYIILLLYPLIRCLNVPICLPIRLLFQRASTKCVGLVQSRHHHHLIDFCDCFSLNWNFKMCNFYWLWMMTLQNIYNFAFPTSRHCWLMWLYKYASNVWKIRSFEYLVKALWWVIIYFFKFFNIIINITGMEACHLCQGI